MLGAVAATCLSIGLQGHSVVLAHPALVGRTEPTRAQRTALPFVRSRPLRLDIPSIGLDVRLTTLGLTPAGAVQVPTDFYVPGWYRLGPSPGERGSAVILGHVDSYQGPAVFFELRDLTVGAHVYVTLADRVRLEFSVIGVAMYHKSTFPDELVFGPRTYSALQLVTCGGTFDTATGHYLSNLVVYTTLVGEVGHAARTSSATA